MGLLSSICFALDSTNSEGVDGTSFTKTYHVNATSAAASDRNPGTEGAPFKTIQHAADVLMPGERVIIHAGTYREWVKPARGGGSPDQAITYVAALGEDVQIKGSEQITTWKDQGGGIWKADVRKAMFGNYNPYALNVSAEFQTYGKWHHRGDVYLDGEGLTEVQSPDEVKATPMTWHCQAGKDTTEILANFGKANPNSALAEINVRESVFVPQISGLGYITVDGLHLMHSAENWQPPWIYPSIPVQTGLIAPRGGRHWVIQNCRIMHARCVGICLGIATETDDRDVNNFGNHLVRNNIVERCGQAGIAGDRGASMSLIADNLVQDINDRREFGGDEIDGIKFHMSLDTEIRGNLIRRIRREKPRDPCDVISDGGGYGIWIDWSNQGTRITGNIIYCSDSNDIFLEMNHGPILVENNILMQGGIASMSEANVIAHNLFLGCPFAFASDTNRYSCRYKPHTRIPIGVGRPGIPSNDRWHNNIFVKRGLEKLMPFEKCVADNNVFLAGAKKSTWGDQASLESSFVPIITLSESDRGVKLEFTLNQDAVEAIGPWVSAKMIGVLDPSEQSIEDRYANPITVNQDIRGQKRLKPIPGPLAAPISGTNTINWQITQASSSSL
jgi:hypothetical protein